MSASNRQKSVLSVLIAALLVFSTVVAVAILAVPHASAAPASVNSSVPTVAGAAPPPPAPPTQVVCTNPNTFGIGTPTTTYGYSGGNAPCSTTDIFPSGSIVSFWLSTTSASTGIVGSAIGTATLHAGSGNLDNVFTLTIPAGTTAGTYYLLANSNAAPLSYQYGGAIVVATEPSFTISPSTASPQMSLGEMGTGWDGAALIHVTISYANAPYPMPTGAFFTVAPVQIDSFTTTAAGNFPASQASVALPELGAGTYVIVAQEMSTGVNYPIGLMTADATLTIQGSVGTCYASGFPSYETCSAGPVAPLGMVASTSGTATLTYMPYLTGGGFTAGAAISSITIGGVAATFAPATATVAADGSFTVQITALASTIHTQGPATIIVVTSPASTPSSYPDAIVVSNPGIATDLMATDLATGASNGFSADPLMYQGWGFAAEETGAVYFDGVAQTEVSDHNGYFLDVSESVPYLPAGAYNVFADIYGYTASTTFTIMVYSGIFDSSGFGNSLSGEYAVTGSQVEVYAQSLGPMQQVDVIDTGLVSAYGTSSLDLAIALGFSDYSISGGHYNPMTGAIQAASVGYVDIYYNLPYSGLATGTSETITLVTLPSASTVVSATYFTVGPAVTTLASSYAPGPAGTVSLSISGLIPNGSAVTPETAGYAGPFGIQLDGSPVTFSSPVAGSYGFWSTATGTASVVFANIATNPVEDFVLWSSVDPTDGATTVPSQALYFNLDFITSTPSVSSGTVSPNPSEQFSANGGTGLDPSEAWLFYADPAGAVYAIVFDIYNFPANTAITVTVWTAAGPSTSTVTTDANGGALYVFTPPSTNAALPDGSLTYLLTFSAGSSITITGNEWYWGLLTGVGFNQAPYADSGGFPATDFAAYFGSYAIVGAIVTVYVSNYLPNSPLSLVMTPSATAPLSGSHITDTNLVAQATTDANGDATFTFTVPPSQVGLTVTGTWYLYVVENTFNSGHGPFNINTNGLIIEFPDFTLYDSLSATVPAVAGFPGQIVYFDWVPTTLPSPGIPVSVTIMLNGTAYATAPATFTGTDVVGSFLLPNSNPGSYWFVGLAWTQVTDSGGNTVVSSYGSSSASLFFLAEGNGALLTGIGPDQIAEITAAVNATITTSMAVPLTELNAAVTAINGAVVEITTAFGNMTTTLNAINATLTAVANGVVTIQTEFGTVTAALSAIGATLVSVQSDVLQVNTTLGMVQLTLDQVNASLVSISDGVMNLTTAVGALQVSVNSVSATLSTVSGNVATIQTDMGTVQATLSSLQTTINTMSVSVSQIKTNVNSLLGATVYINTTLGTLTGTVSAISGQVATIATAVGNIQTDVTSIQGTVNTINSNTSSTPNFTTYLIIVIVLVIIAIVVALLAVMRVNAVARQLEGRSGAKSWEPPSKGGGEEPPKSS